MYVSLFVSVDKGKALVPWTIINLDDAQDYFRGAIWESEGQSVNDSS